MADPMTPERIAELRAGLETWGFFHKDDMRLVLDALTRAQQEIADLREALTGLAIDGVTAGANPQKDGTMTPPLWHLHCRLCDARWSKQQWKEPREHPVAPDSPFKTPCILALGATGGTE